MKETWIDKLDKKFGRYGIKNFMSFIVIMMAGVYVLDLVFMMRFGVSLSSWLAFDRAAIMHGQIWRLITFIFIPPESSMLFIILALYFNWMIGSGLESQWGAFRFNLFYICGIIGTIIAGFITGYATNSYLNLSLFLIFAFIYPNFEVLLFFFIPIKIKYLAILDGVGLLLLLIFNSWSGRLAIIIAFANVILFTWPNIISSIKNAKRRHDWKKNFKD